MIFASRRISVGLLIAVLLWPIENTAFGCSACNSKSTNSSERQGESNTPSPTIASKPIGTTVYNFSPSPSALTSSGNFFKNLGNIDAGNGGDQRSERKLRVIPGEYREALD